VAAEVMVIPRSCSWTIQSIVAPPSWTSPILLVLAGVKEDSFGRRGLAASMCAMIPILRTLSRAISRAVISRTFFDYQRSARRPCWTRPSWPRPHDASLQHRHRTRVNDLIGEPLGHGLFAALLREIRQPADSQCSGATTDEPPSAPGTWCHRPRATLNAPRDVRPSWIKSAASVAPRPRCRWRFVLVAPLHWLSAGCTDFAKKRREKTMARAAANEIIDASNGVGAAVKRRETWPRWPSPTRLRALPLVIKESSGNDRSRYRPGQGPQYWDHGAH